MTASLSKWLQSRVEPGTFEAEHPKRERVHNELRFEGPNGENQWSYCQEHLNERWGLEPMMLFMGHGRIFPHVKGMHPVAPWISEGKVRRHLELLEQGALVHLCIEGGYRPGEDDNWGLVGYADGHTGFCEQAADRWRRFAAFCRQCNPDVWLGVYGAAVMQYPTWLLGPHDGPDDRPGSAALALRDRWHELQEQSAPVLREFDVLMPDIYVRSTWPLEKARRYARLICGTQHVHGVEIIPCLWPDFTDLFAAVPHGHDTLEKQIARRVPPDYWKALLDDVLDRVDAVQLWQFNRGEPIPIWDDDAPWWTATQQVLIERGVVPLETAVGNT